MIVLWPLSGLKLGVVRSGLVDRRKKHGKVNVLNLFSHVSITVVALVAKAQPMVPKAGAKRLDVSQNNVETAVLFRLSTIQDFDTFCNSSVQAECLPNGTRRAEERHELRSFINKERHSIRSFTALALRTLVAKVAPAVHGHDVH